MRRRIKEDAGPGAPPLPLTRYRGSSNREAMTWLHARSEWWTKTRDPDDSGWLRWLLEGHDQVGDLPWCGSLSAGCGDPDCMCVVWPEELANDDPEPNPIPNRKAAR